MDHYTKLLYAAPIKNKRSSTIAQCFRERVLPFLPAVPNRVLTDNGGEFVGSEFQAVLSDYGMKSVCTTPNHPSSNGLIERANRTLIQLLRLKSEVPEDWLINLSRALIVHNSTLHSTLGQSPSQFLLLGEHKKEVLPLIPTQIRELWREGPSWIYTL